MQDNTTLPSNLPYFDATNSSKPLMISSLPQPYFKSPASRPWFAVPDGHCKLCMTTDLYSHPKAFLGSYQKCDYKSSMIDRLPQNRWKNRKHAVQFTRDEIDFSIVSCNPSLSPKEMIRDCIPSGLLLNRYVYERLPMSQTEFEVR